MASERTQFQLSGDRRRSSELSQQPTQPPTAVPGYVPQRFLGAGAYGEVWVAVDRNTGRQVAIKFFEHRAGVNWSLLSREVEKLVFLTADRYVVQIIQVGWDADPPYYIMEYVEGGSLDDRIQARGPLNVPEAVSMFRDVVIGMSHAHGKGVLHCDLKPANVLLDQDEKPRIADFGQSRLASEQKPALGTLFYMPPEQASLDSMPDARWDVYALGALLYCMIMGRPPHRSGEAVSEIDSGTSLNERLDKYREFIKAQPPVTDHRKVKGVDRALSNIIERCLEVDPNKRFASVLRVLDALDARENSQARRPLQLLGIVGPLLLLMTFGVFGYRAYQQAIKRTEQQLTVKSQESNQFAAVAEAEAVGGHIHRRFTILDQVARDDGFARLVNSLVTNEESAVYLETLGKRDLKEKERDRTRDEFRVLRLRGELQGQMERLKSNPRHPPVASWFITDANGTMLAAAFGGPVRTPVGKNYMHRTYFHGGPKDDKESEFKPLERIQISTAFESDATNTYKVAISAPVKYDNEIVGVLAVTLELGDFVAFEETTEDFCAFLVDGRPNQYQGIIFQHPLYSKLPRPDGKLPIDISAAELRADLATLRNKEAIEYVDPLGQIPEGQAYTGDWIAAASPVTFPWLDNNLEAVKYDTGLLLAVERRVSSAISPVKKLARTLLGEAIAALLVILLLSLVMWYFVSRMIRDSMNAARRGFSAGEVSSTVHSRDTIAMPDQAISTKPQKSPDPTSPVNVGQAVPKGKSDLAE